MYVICVRRRHSDASTVGNLIGSVITIVAVCCTIAIAIVVGGAINIPIIGIGGITSCISSLIRTRGSLRWSEELLKFLCIHFGVGRAAFLALSLA